MMIGYDIYDCFTMAHFRLRQRMTLATKIYCSRLYRQLHSEKHLQLCTKLVPNKFYFFVFILSPDV
jgi:hypothetical protein